MIPLYVLTRTSGRPEFFKRCRESVLALNYPDVVHIVHVDDPRCESYVEGDIIIRGEAHGQYMGTAPYNLYNNRLVKAIPGDGWVHFLDDDDQYCEPEVFDWLTGQLPPEKIHVCKARRWEGTVWPKNWKNQRSFQTECFVTRTAVAKRATWWGNKGGDHNYTRQLTRLFNCDWHDIIVTEAQEGKGHGRLIDAGGAVMDYDAAIKPETIVWVKMHRDARGKAGGRAIKASYSDARVLEKFGYGKVTYKGTEICNPQARPA
jgi:hypothetical protein